MSSHNVMDGATTAPVESKVERRYFHVVLVGAFDDLDEDDLREMRRLLERFLPDANGPLKHHDVCMYTNTPDRNFLVDFHPDHPNVLIVGGCSGHGFKFAPVIGELARTLLAGNQGNDDLEMFRMDRLTEGL